MISRSLRTLTKTVLNQRTLYGVTRAQNIALRRNFSDKIDENEDSNQEEAEEFVEPVLHDTKQHSFKAETRKLLDIVAKSLYTDAEVFLRELLSNCSDALEKQRLLEVSGQSTGEGDPHQIIIVTDEAKRQIVITDTGVGMTQEEMINNLGTIASSGSKQFLEEYSTSSDVSTDGIIGQFGVGFYSSFIVGHTVQVISKREGEDAYLWVSDGSGDYSLSRVETSPFDRGTRITIFLNPEHVKFSQKYEIDQIVDKFSNFINYPIFINGERKNKVEAIWGKDKRDVSESDYKELWQHVSKSTMPYKYLLHFNTDMPLQIRSIIYIPQSHREKMNMGSQESLEVDLYSRKILIKKNCKDLFPEYLRFLKGVVDCEDLPLNISRENFQDTALIARLRSTLTKRVLKHLADMLKKDKQAYYFWYQDFSTYIKQGVWTDDENNQALIKLMRFNSNKSNNVSLDDYIESMAETQNNIYYVLGETTESCLNSVYFEPFKDSDIPVLLLTAADDDYVLTKLQNYKGKKFVSPKFNPRSILKVTMMRSQKILSQMNMIPVKDFPRVM